MRLTLLFEFLYYLTEDQLKDLTIFINISSLPLTVNQHGVFQKLIKQQQKAIKRDKLVIEEDFKNSLEASHKNQWDKYKNVFAKVVKKFILMQIENKSDLLSQYLILEYYHKNKLDKNFNMFSKYFIKKVSSNHNSTHKLVEYLSKNNLILPSQKLNRKKEDYISNTIKALNDFYSIERLRLEIARLTSSAIIDRKAKQINLTLTIPSIQDSTSPLVKILYDLYHFLLAPSNEKDYLNIKNNLNTSGQTFSPPIKREITHILMNYCTYQLNTGNYQFVEHYQEHVNYLEANNLLLENQQFEGHRFHNYITMALIMKKLDWVERIIKQKGQFVTGKFKSFFIVFNQARLFFYQKRYKESNKLLDTLKPIDPQYHIQLQKLQIMISIVIEDHKFLSFKLSNLHKYINSHYTSDNPKNISTQNFITCINRLLKNEAIRLASFKGRIAILDYHWLQEMKEKRGY